MLNQINYIKPNYKDTMLRNTNCLTSGEEGITEDYNNTIYFRKIEDQDCWVAEDIYGSSYEFSCHHCGGELENATSGYCKNDVSYCHNCAFDLFDQPKPISAYQIWKQKKDQEIATFKREEAERRRIREEREERERRYMREHQEEIEERQALREEQSRERLREYREVQKEQEEQEHMYEDDFDVLIIESKYDFECCYCGIEMTETDGYSINDDLYCCLCACELEKQEEDIQSTRLTCEYTDPEEHDPRFNFDDLIEDPLAMPNLEDSRERDEDSSEFIRKIKSNSIDDSLEVEIVSIIPEDAIKLDEEFIMSNSFDEAKEELANAIYNKDTDIAQELADAYIVSQHSGRFWYKLTADTKKPDKYIISLYMKKDEVATKYLIRQLEECMYYIDLNAFPDDYYNYNEEEVDYNNYYTKKALCVTCGEVNYAELVYEVEDHPRMVCSYCIKKVNRCDECNIVTLDYVFRKSIETSDLCFDCNFKTKERVQMPLEEHLLVRRDIQHLRKTHFDVLVDYAELAQLTIFEAYRYKSKCHFYDCIQRISPSSWDAEETRQFCCSRHCEYADESGCHCTNVWNGTDYDDDYQEATCKICNSPHEANVKSRVELRTSNEGFKPIVSAIHFFNEELCMSNILAESLVDLCEYFK
jgi:hypothetical protein